MQKLKSSSRDFCQHWFYKTNGDNFNQQLDDNVAPFWARSKTLTSRKTRKPRRISFPRFSTPSFPFCTIPKTENSEMKTSECCFKPFYQTPSFSNSESSILHYTQNGKLGDENLGVLFQAFLPNSEFFQLQVFHFALYPKRKTRR